MVHGTYIRINSCKLHGRTNRTHIHEHQMMRMFSLVSIDYFILFLFCFTTVAAAAAAPFVIFLSYFLQIDFFYCEPCLVCG